MAARKPCQHVGEPGQRIDPVQLGSDPAPVWWLFRSLRGSGCQENALAQQVQACPTIHLALDQLEAVDLPLGLAAAPGQAQGGPNRGAVLAEVSSDTRN